MPAVAIPYKSSNEMMLSVAGGQTLFAIADGPPDGPAGARRQDPRARGDRIGALIRAAGRAEHGGGRAIRMSNIGLWSGVFVLAGTPPAIARQARDASCAARWPTAACASKLKAMAVNPGSAAGDEFRRIIDADIMRFGEIAREANLKFEE